jgi:hypothetical protein
VAGALPDVAGLSNGHSAVETVPPDTASQTGIHHAQAGGEAGVGSQNVTPASDGDAADVDATSSDARLEGLTTAAGNVTNEHASAVIETLIVGTPGPGFGADVATVASDGHSQAPTDVPPTQAFTGLSHRP